MANIQLSLGPMLIGVYLNLILFEILIMQIYFYLHTCRRDSKWIKFLVLYLFFIETANSFFDMIMMYQPLIIGWGTDSATEVFPTLFLTEPITIVLVSTPIQLFFAWRIKQLTASNWLSLFMAILSLGSIGGGVWTGIRIPMVKLFINKPMLHWPALTWLLCSCIADTLITVGIVRSLLAKKTGTGRTDSVLDKIIKMTVQTGLIMTICALGDVIFFLVLPHTALNFIWDMSLSKLYTNCLLSTLNARSTLTASGYPRSGSSHIFSSRHPATNDLYSEDADSQSHELQPL
ncbi:hypothetical protein C8J56DRAFT_1035665, partial [Mycena floridula]